MSQQDCIAYPRHFLTRMEDRLLLDSLGQKGIHPDKAKLILYRIWADYATGGVDRREVELVSGSVISDRSVRLIEIFCEWEGGQGDLVQAALGAGFLEIQRKDGKAWLVCKGFFPINSGWSANGRQDKRSGAYSRAAKVQRAKAEEDAASHLRLLQSTSRMPEGLSESQSSAALLLVHRVIRALKIPRSEAGEMNSKLLFSAWEILDSSSEEEVHGLLMWLIQKRADPQIPKTVPEILMAWRDLAQTAKSEMT